jgi:hypothetical protein
MGLCERLVDASCAAMNAARSGNVAEAYRFALTMISIAYEIELHEEIAPGLAAVEQVVWTERSCSWRRPRGVMEDPAAARNR